LSVQINHINYVIAGKNISVENFSITWLMKEGIFSEAEVDRGVTTPIFKQYENETYSSLFTPDRIQITIKKPSEVSKKSAPQIAAILNKIILKYTNNYFALGINLSFEVPVKGKIETVSKKLFLPNSSEFANFFSEENNLFGGAFSKDFEGFKLTLGVDPHKNDNADTKDKFRLSFNYNYLFSQDGGTDAMASDTIKMLNKYDEIYDFSNKIASCLDVNGER